MIDAERRAALEAVAAEIRACRRCRLNEGRTRAVPGEGHPATEVVFVGEAPGLNEDRSGRPFVGRAGDLLVELLATIGWRRDEVFITNIVKCRPPDNRDPAPDEIAACLPYLRRQLQALDPSLVVTLGRYSLARFMPGATITRAHGTIRPAEPSSGAPSALVLATYHPAAALRAPAIEAVTRADVRLIPRALEEARARRSAAEGAVPAAGSPATGPGEEASAAAGAGPAEAAPPGTEPVLDTAAEAPASPVTALQPADEPPPDTAAEVLPPLPPPADEPAADQLTLF